MSRCPSTSAPARLALTYAKTAGPEYLQQTLLRGLNDQDAAVALGAAEALATNAGENSLVYTVGPAQPMLQALSFSDRAVRYTAAIAIANAGPRQAFNESRLVVQNLAEALALNPQAVTGGWTAELAQDYALRAVQALLKVGASRNPVMDLSLAQAALVAATRGEQQNLQVLAGQTLAYLGSPNAQRAIAEMALRRLCDGGADRGFCVPGQLGQAQRQSPARSDRQSDLWPDHSERPSPICEPPRRPPTAP